MPFGISLLQRESLLRVSGEEGSPEILISLGTSSVNYFSSPTAPAIVYTSSILPLSVVTTTMSVPVKIIPFQIRGMNGQVLSRYCYSSTSENIELLLERDKTIRQFRKDNYPLIGMGAAIIAAFLALAGAAWSLDLPYFLSFNLFCSVYWFFIYLSIYIDILWGVYERTKDMVKRAFTQKRQALIFFFYKLVSALEFSFSFIKKCFQKSKRVT